MLHWLVSMAMVCPALAGTLRVADYARAALRNSVEDSRAAVDFEDALRIDLGLSWPHQTIGLTYIPRLSLMGAFGPEPPLWTLLHSGEASWQYRTPRLMLSVSENASIGQQSFFDIVQRTPIGLLAGAPPMTTSTSTTTNASDQALSVPRLNLVPEQRAVSVAAERTVASIWYLLHPRWSYELHGSYGISGGRDPKAQATLPRQYIAEAGSGLAYDLDRRQRFSAGLSGGRIWTSQNYAYWLLGLSGTWYARWSEALSSSLMIGSNWQETDTPDHVQHRTIVPYGTAALVSSATIGDRTRTALLLQLDYTPIVNTLTGTLQNRMTGTAAVSLVQQRTSASLGASVSQSLPFDAPDTTRSAGVMLNLGYIANTWLALSFGAQLAKQDVNGIEAPNSLLWMIYAGVSAQSSTLQF